MVSYLHCHLSSTDGGSIFMIKMLTQWGITRFKVNIRSLSFWLITALMTIVFILSRNVAGHYNEDTVVLVYTGEESSETADECYRLIL